MHWIFSLDGGPKRTSPAAVLIGDKIFSFGSESTKATKSPMEVFVLNCYTFRWRKLEDEEPWVNAPSNRCWYTAVVYENKTYIWGGKEDSNIFASNELHEYDPANNSWRVVEARGEIPLPLALHSACVIGDRMLIFGGMDPHGLLPNLETFAFHFPTAAWSKLPALVEPELLPLFTTAIAIGNRMFVTGGMSQLELKYLDVDEGSWHEPLLKSPSPPGRRGHSAWVHNEKMYIFGGFGIGTMEGFNTILEFDPEQCQWREVQTLGEKPEPRSAQSCVIQNHRLFLFGGVHMSQATRFSKLHVLDYEPTLKTLCIMTVKKQGLSSQQLSILPRDLQLDLLAVLKPTKNL